MHSKGALPAALRSRPAVAAAVAATALGLAGAAVPLLEVPGLDLGLAAALLSSLVVAPVLGIAAARRALRAAGRETPGGALGPTLRASGATAAVALLLVAWTLAVAAVRAATTTRCGPLAAWWLFVLVAAPSALLASAVAVAATAVARGRRGRAAALYAAVVLASAAVTALEAYLGPAAAAYDHLLGVWPGPIYDEALAVDARLALFRAGTLGWSAAALAAGVLATRTRGARAGPAVALAAGISAALLARLAGGGAPTRADLAAALGAVREGPRCVVHLAAERGAADAERALRDCEYDAEAIARALGLARAPRVTVWIYRSPDEKRRLVGAGETSFTKPWLAEVHLHDQGVPHPLLRHELVHALASAAAPGPLRVPARAAVLVDAGLVEGLAVALDVPADGHGVHEWARAMRDLGRLPPVEALLAAGGFLRAPPSRAYVAAGSFVRFLLETRGAAAVLASYRLDDVARGTGAPLPALEAAWQRHLDGVVVPPALARAAEARFERGSLFARRCAREIAALERDAAAAAARGRPAEAERALRRASALSGGDPAPLRAAADAWRAADDLGRAEAIAREAIAVAGAAGGRSALRGALLAALGDLRLRAGDPGAAAARYREALALAPGAAEARALRARLAAAGDAALGAAIAPWLLGVGDPAVAASRLAGSDRGLARYLLARARLSRRAPALALTGMSSIDPAALPDASFALELERMRADALCRVGRWPEGVAAWRAVAARASDDGAREAADDAARRCAFEGETYAVPTRWDGDELAGAASPGPARSGAPAPP